jgi:hypothetical protein
MRPIVEPRIALYLFGQAAVDAYDNLQSQTRTVLKKAYNHLESVGTIQPRLLS